MTYALSEKNIAAPCLFAYFLDQAGIIAVGRVIQ
jgi:hypothetical protein